MTTRRTILAGTPALAALASTGGLVSIGAFAAQPDAAPAKHADFLFVQTAKAMTFDAPSGKFTLQGISPVTVFFSDRPDRIAGNMPTASFVPFWSDGKDSFLSDPPNADISIVEGSKLHQVVVVLRDPVLEGDALSYAVKLVGGTMPTTGAEVSVFIDIIGMPMTPLSFAGARRRTYRRAFMYR